jgi:glutaconate CoA-transferase subunit A
MRPARPSTQGCWPRTRPARAPVGGILGSDLVAQRPDWKVRDGVLTVPAIRPDVALFHARWADEAGNVWVGRRRGSPRSHTLRKSSSLLSRSCARATCWKDELLAPGVISSIYVTALARASRGAWPLGMPGHLRRRRRTSSQYAKEAKTREGFQRYLGQWVHTPRKSYSPA